jgi:3-oxoacid CoA-transferase subunit A
MINRWLITGDCHRDFSRFKYYTDEIKNDPNTAVIILGDAGINWTLDKNDDELKTSLCKNYKFYIYCVRGNHEARPQDVPGMKLIYDENVKGEVYYQEEWSTIRYFKDWGLYLINNFEVAVIGGAYSVDKWYRLACGARWFENEQLDDEEMINCTAELINSEVDFVLTHTCPIPWMPVDLFLSGIDQSRVDKSMELFLEEIAQCIGWKIWLFGHYHADRIERPYVEQYSTDTDDLNTIWKRWQDFDKTKEIEWWLVKSPMFYSNDYLLDIRNKYWNMEESKEE